MRTRAYLLVVVVAMALVAVACGRASQDDINQALGITPTATASAEQIAAATSAAETRSAAAAGASPGASPGAAAAAAGDVTRGGLQFLLNCSQCHGPTGAGGNLLAPGGMGAGVTVDTLLQVVREGQNHPSPPGPQPAAQITDVELNDLVAYIQSEAGTP